MNAKAMALIVVLVTALVVLVSYIAYRQVENDGRCEKVLGPGATWLGDTRCAPPPVIVGGLL